jgi:hypothetical protein
VNKADWVAVPLAKWWGMAVDGAYQMSLAWDPTDTWGDRMETLIRGCAGELAIHRLAHAQWRPTLVGDGGTDIPGFCIRATQYWEDPWLQAPASRKDRPKEPRFILCGVDEEKKIVHVVGTYPTEELLRAPVKMVRVPTHVVSWKKLQPWRGGL